VVRDQEVDGSNPFAPTNFFNHLQNLILLQIGSIGSNIGFKESRFSRHSLTKLRSYMRVAGCCSQSRALIVAYGKVLAMLTALQQLEEFYTIVGEYEFSECVAAVN